MLACNICAKEVDGEYPFSTEVKIAQTNIRGRSDNWTRLKTIHICRSCQKKGVVIEIDNCGVSVDSRE